MIKTPDEIKYGLEFAGTSNVARKLELAKQGSVAYAYTEDLAMDALAYIQQLEAKVAQWINVNDRLPERGQRVIFLDKDKRMIYVGSYRGKGGGGACHFLANNRLMTANWWMELPELPKEEP